MSNLLSPTEASDQWGIHRTILYKKMRAGKLSYTKDVSSSGKSRRLIDPAEMLRVFGEPEPATCKSEIKHETVTTPPGTSIYMDYIEQLKEQIAKKDILLEKQADLLEAKDEQVQSLIDQLNDVNQRLLPAPDDTGDDFEESEPPKTSKRRWWQLRRKVEILD
jgi:hypothetical protein